jgi:hypothetical protein
MTTLTGRSGALLFRGRQVAKVRSYSLELDREAVDDTCIGDDARTFVRGLFSASGSAVVLVDPSDEAGRDMLNSVLPSGVEGRQDIRFLLDRATGRALDGIGFLTSVSAGVSVGDAHSASVRFQLSGTVQGGF